MPALSRSMRAFRSRTMSLQLSIESAGRERFQFVHLQKEQILGILYCARFRELCSFAQHLRSDYAHDANHGPFGKLPNTGDRLMRLAKKETSRGLPSFVPNCFMASSAATAPAANTLSGACSSSIST